MSNPNQNRVFSNSVGMKNDELDENFQLKEKKTRKTRKVPLNNEIVEVKEIKNNEPVEIVQEMSYHKAKSLMPKREMSEKQKANIEKLVKMNKERRDKARQEKEKETMKQELLKKIEEEQKLKEQNKLVRVKTVIRPRKPHVKKPKNFNLVEKQEFDPYTEEDTTANESTDTQTIKKAQRKIKQIEEVEKQCPAPNSNDTLRILMDRLF